ncbi:threonine synthase [Brevundimonas sp. Root1279]|uniref:threonine synthase n=1 Tax=Brevundimonas sp. Root1279 TaxID=1736443 RepID=UPI0006F20880|nr:threonine synthase [Brevundimonas sp. Root1279]KQW80848.1 threonine synthase [Brevundimonas sp. Root1279]
MSAQPSYVSTRGRSGAVGFVEALLSGVARDGGLYVPARWPTLSPEALTADGPAATAEAVLRPFIGDSLPEGALARATRRLTDGFDDPAATPLVEVAPGLFVLELFHGPTAAFKDYAMQMVAVLAEAALEASGERLRLVTATSGDTGAAAVRAFGGLERVELVVLHPLGRVSPVQRLQMTTTGAANVKNLAVRGDFDDCQRLVKALLADPRTAGGGRLSSVNSINWARLAGQIPYYVGAARALGAQAARATYVVPTGNFGDAFAGWAARRMGLPMGGIVAPTNRNDALVRALQTGVYARAQAAPTASVSMDVQAPSNFERLLFEASGRDADLTRGLFEDFASDGRMVLPEDLLAALRREVRAVSVSEAETAAEIARTHAETGRVICPHTAVALHAARRLDRSAGPVVALSTAHAAKFPESVEAALGFAPERPRQLEGLEGRAEVFETVDPTLDAVLAALA